MVNDKMQWNILSYLEVKANQFTSWVEKVLLAAQPTGKFVTVEQISDTMEFLLSDGAANITGTALSIDGGWTAQ